MSGPRWTTTPAGHFWSEPLRPDLLGGPPLPADSATVRPRPSVPRPSPSGWWRWGPCARPESVIDVIRARPASVAANTDLVAQASAAVLGGIAELGRLATSGRPRPCRRAGADVPRRRAAELADFLDGLTVRTPSLSTALATGVLWEPLPLRAGSWSCLSRVVPDGRCWVPLLPPTLGSFDPVAEAGVHIGQVLELVAVGSVPLRTLEDLVGLVRRHPAVREQADRATIVAAQYALSHAERWGSLGPASAATRSRYVAELEAAHAAALV